MTKISRRDALATGFGLAAFGTVLSDLGYAEETATKDAVWRFAPVDVKLVGKLVYENYDAGGCLYGAFKGAVLAYAAAVESVDAEAARVARSCPFVAFRCARGGFGRLKELCGAVAGGVMFFSCFLDDYADVCKLAAALGEYSRETALPEYVPEKDDAPNFLRVVAKGLTCREMGGAWMKAATDEQKKLVGERCKRHTASIMVKAAELLNAHFAEKAAKATKNA